MKSAEEWCKEVSVEGPSWSHSVYCRWVRDIQRDAYEAGVRDTAKFEWPDDDTAVDALLDRFDKETTDGDG